MARTLVLVDGSNVARCTAWRRGRGADASDHELRRRLVDAISSWSAQSGHDACVTFDGAGPWRAGSTQVTPNVEVVGSGAREGDDILERRAAMAREHRRAHWIVTDDHAVRQVAGAGADRVVAADAFVAELTAAPTEAELQSQASMGTGDGASRLDASLDDDVRSRLERLRRGESLD